MRKQDVVLSVASGGLLALSFPPLGMGFVAYFGLVPFLLAIRQKSWRDAAYLGFLMGLAFHGGSFYWIAIITVLGGMIAVLVCALHIALFALLLRVLLDPAGRRRSRSWGKRLRSEQGVIWAAPLLWTAMEYLRSFGALGFPWATLGHSQTEYLPLIQYASVTSVYGVSCWIVVVNAALYQLVRRFQDTRRLALSWCIAVGLLFVVPYAHGRWAMHRCDAAGPSAPRMGVAIVQPNIGPREKWDDPDQSLEVLPAQTVEAAVEHPDLIIWPESALPFYLLREPWLVRRMHVLADSLGVPILTGALHASLESEALYNAAFLFLPQSRSVQYYFKMNLVPVSERVPFQRVLPFLADLTMGRAGSFSPGRQRTLFRVPRARFATLICYESIFPHLARSFVKQGAELLVVITNDAWFGPWSSASQHAHIAVFRAIEHRIPVARSANTGISMFVDPCGRMLQPLGLSVRGTTVREIRLRHGATFFSKHGNLFSLSSVVLVVAALAWVGAGRVRQRDA